MINSAILEDVIFRKISDTFVQWRDSNNVYGINFDVNENADLFMKHFNIIFNKLKFESNIKTINPEMKSTGTLSTASSNDVIKRNSSHVQESVREMRRNSDSPVYNNVGTLKPKSQHKSKAQGECKWLEYNKTYRRSIELQNKLDESRSEEQLSQSIIHKDPKLLGKREKILKELYTTEFSYGDQLRDILNVKKKNSIIISKKSNHQIFWKKKKKNHPLKKTTFKKKYEKTAQIIFFFFFRFAFLWPMSLKHLHPQN